MECGTVSGFRDDVETAPALMRLPQRLWLCTTATDMRKFCDGLTAIVRTQFADEPMSGDGFVFINRRRTRMKCVYFEAGGYCIWSERLEQRLFARGSAADTVRVSLSQTEFAALIEGLEVAVKRCRKRYEKPV